MTSPTLATLSDGAERLFWRLIPAADDYGRFDANPTVILGRCFPLMTEAVTPARVQKLLSELAASGAVCLYEARGSRVCGYFPQWFSHQRRRETRPKFPDPPGNARNCGKLPQSAARASETETETEPEAVVSSGGVGECEGKGVYPPEFERLWKLYPRRSGVNPKRPAFESWHARLSAGVPADLLERAVGKYAAWCEATGKIGTEFVMQTASFFGPRKAGWQETWEIPTPSPTRNGRKPRSAQVYVSPSGRRFDIGPEQFVKYEDPQKIPRGWIEGFVSGREIHVLAGGRFE